MSRRQLLGTTLLLEGAVLALAYGLRAWFDFGRDAPLRLGPSELGWGVALTVPPFAFLLWSSRQPTGPFRRLNDQVLEIVRTLFQNATVVDAAIISVFAGWGEELLFRGVLQVWLTRVGGFWVGWLVASLAFGLAHMISSMYVVVVVAIGLYLGMLAHVFDSLGVPIVVHGLYDFLALLYLMRVVRRTSPTAPTQISE